jgi:hypothetical protein
MDKQELTPEQKKQIRLENLAKGREKALAKRREVVDLKKKEKEVQLAERQKKLNERWEKVKQYEASKQEPKVEEQKATKPKKKIQVEVSDSSDDDSTATESDSDESVEYVIERKPKKVAVKKVVKKSENAPKQPTMPQSKSQLTTEVAKNILKQKLMDDASAMAMRSLFPFHNF